MTLISDWMIGLHYIIMTLGSFCKSTTKLIISCLKCLSGSEPREEAGQDEEEDGESRTALLTALNFSAPYKIISLLYSVCIAFGNAANFLFITFAPFAHVYYSILIPAAKHVGLMFASHCPGRCWTLGQYPSLF